ncbi:restriction endonuclease subunit S [Lactobacillus delbrueckii]|uniref:restriction endonuclease subunit S n=2 Tax=Lactobacillus delbrueckii TaxID=1584 RepID=UPI003A8B6D25
MANFSKGTGYSKSDLKGTGSPIILYGRLYTKYETIIRNVDSFVVPKSGSVFSKGGEVIVPGSGETAEDISIASVVEPAGILLGGDLNIIYPNSDLDPTFLAITISNGKPHFDMARRAQGKSIVHLHNADLKHISLKTPNLSEQKRISKIFEVLDQTITLHEEKKRQLERLKSALLQKMFADKSGYPAVRFKGFDDIWDQEKLNSLVRLHRGLTYSPNNVQDSGIRVLRSSNILDGQFVMTDDDIFVKSSVVNIPTVKDGDILITAANGSIKLVGKHAIISGISENTAVSGGFMLVGSSRIPDFVNSLFDTSWYQRFIRKYVTGGNGSIGNLKKNDLDKQYVKVPTTSEQGRIGEFFREIDQLIINNQIKHEKLLELKKFLLQNMFI